MIRGSIRFSQSVVCKEGIRNISPYVNLYDVEVEFGCGDVEVEWRSTPSGNRHHSAVRRQTPSLDLIPVTKW